MAETKQEVGAGRVVLVIGSMAWGRGKTEAVALRNWRKNVPLLAGMVDVAVVNASEDAYVDDMGTVCTPDGKDKPVLIRYRGVSVK